MNVTRLADGAIRVPDVIVDEKTEAIGDTVAILRPGDKFYDLWDNWLKGNEPSKDTKSEMARWAMSLETKAVRHVRTPSGVRRYKLPVGSIIVGHRKLDNLTIVGDHPEFLDMVVVKGKDGKKYDVSKYDGKWWATEHNDTSWGKDLFSAPTEDALYEKLDKHAAGSTPKKEPAKKAPAPKAPSKPAPKAPYGIAPKNAKLTSSRTTLSGSRHTYVGDNGEEYQVSVRNKVRGGGTIYDLLDSNGDHIASGNSSAINKKLDQLSAGKPKRSTSSASSGRGSAPSASAPDTAGDKPTFGYQRRKPNKEDDNQVRIYGNHIPGWERSSVQIQTNQRNALAISKSLEETERDLPGAKQALTYVHTVKRLGSAHGNTYEAGAHYDPNTHTLTVADNFMAEWQDGLTVANGDPKVGIDHEFGHALLDSFAGDDVASWGEGLVRRFKLGRIGKGSVDTNPSSPTFLELLPPDITLNVSAVAEHLSPYAGASMNELIAEGWAQYRRDGSNASPLARAIGQYITKQVGPGNYSKVSKVPKSWDKTNVEGVRKYVFSKNAKIPLMALVAYELEMKIRHVATPAGVAHFHEPIGTPIVAHGDTHISLPHADAPAPGGGGGNETIGARIRAARLAARAKQPRANTLRQRQEAGEPAKRVRRAPAAAKTTTPKAPARRTPTTTPKTTTTRRTAPAKRTAPSAKAPKKPKPVLRLRPATEEDIKERKIPRHLTDVVVNDDLDSHVIAKGRDGKGRLITVYKPWFRDGQDAIKFQRVKVLNQHLDELDAQLEKDAPNSEEAAALLLIRVFGMRPGSATKDTKADFESFGATDIEARHVNVTPAGQTSITFVPGKKKGETVTIKTKHPLVAQVMRERLKTRSRRTKMFDTNEDKTRDYFRTIVPEQFQLKDLRTLRGTVLALEMIVGKRKPTSAAEYKRRRNEIGDYVSSQLGNTRAVALKSYVDGTVFDPWRQEGWKVP